MFGFCLVKRQHVQQDRTGQEKVGRQIGMIKYVWKVNVYPMYSQCKVERCHRQQDRTGLEKEEWPSVWSMYSQCKVNVYVNVKLMCNKCMYSKKTGDLQDRTGEGRGGPSGLIHRSETSRDRWGHHSDPHKYNFQIYVLCPGLLWKEVTEPQEVILLFIEELTENFEVRSMLYELGQ